MRTILLGLALALALPASSTWAAIEIELSRPTGYGNGGGVFDVTYTNSPLASFQTFCAELQQHISFGPKYVVNSTTETENDGGYSLGTEAAWLYTQFRANIIQVTSTLEANALQLGIWRSMDYSDTQILNAMTGQGNWSASYIAILETQRLNDWIAMFNNDIAWTSNGPEYIGNVRIMNLLTTSGGPAQDQLIIVTPPDPEPGTVPEPATIAVWSALLGMGLVAAKRRRVA